MGDKRYLFDVLFFGGHGHKTEQNSESWNVL